MSLRQKSLLIVGGTIVALLIVLVGVSQTIMAESFAELERRETSVQVERAQSAVQGRVDALRTVVGDWAPWDDTYQFLEDRNQGYIDSNLNLATLDNLGVDFMVFVRSTGEVVYAAVYDEDTGEQIDLPAGLQDHMDPGGLLLRHTSEESSVAGLLVLPGGPFLVASQPILTSEFAGPTEGALIVGAALDEAEIAHLEEITSLSIDATLVGTEDLSADLSTALELLEGGEQTPIIARGDQSISGYAAMPDIYGEPAAILRVTTGRDVHQSGTLSTTYVTLAVLVVGAVLLLVVWLIMERLLLGRLSALSRRVDEIRRVHRLADRVSAKGSDEISLLGREINGLLESVERSELDLLRFQKELIERAEELATTNLALESEIRQRVATEEVLRESRARAESSQRLEAVGVLAGGVAHDFNNLLTAIGGYAEFGQVQSKGDPALDEVFGEIRKSADRAADLTWKLLAFSSRQPLQPRVVDLNAVTESVSGLLRRLIGEDVELALRCQEELWAVEVDPGQIEQIVTNLVINARDAMPGGGRITVGTANVELGEEHASTHPGSRLGPHVLLTVGDTGHGIDPEILPHIFEPFFTTKEYGKGTGLGLSTVYGIVQQSCGGIWAHSEPGQGTVFKIYLPRSDKPIDWTPRSRPAQEPRSLGGAETILIVEDEPAVRAVTARTLKGAGYTVLEEEDPHEALKLYEHNRGPVHLLLTDVVLPGMSGKDLADCVGAKPGTSPRVLFMSGYAQDTIVHDGRLDPDVNFLRKPFTRDGLLRKVRAVLDGPLDAQPLLTL